MGLLKEFKEFALRGNVVDMTIGVIIGGAFGKVVSSVVKDLIMPPFGKLLGNVNFNDLFFSLDPDKTQDVSSLSKAQETGAAIIAYGLFLNTVIDFIIMAVCIFLAMKAMNKLTSAVMREKPPDPTTKECPFCISEIPIRATRCAHCTSELPAATTGAPDLASGKIPS
jgi:large conductance mechanosensitive channel